MLNGKRMVSLFYQPSLRTRMSFELAMDYLGGRTVFASENAREFSSAKKGESLRDTIRVVNRYRPDVIILRYDREIGAERAVEVSKIPIINAGDREPGQHPTQGLLDLWAIRECRGEIDGLKIAMVGDLKEGRTVRSLSYLLGKFEGVTIYFVSPKELQMKDDVKDYLKRHNVFFEEGVDLRNVASRVDVIYQTRVQRECGSKIDWIKYGSECFTVTKEICGAMAGHAIIMHPLPRDENEQEITSEVDSDNRAVYLTDQIDSGLFTRMALLKMILAPDI